MLLRKPTATTPNCSDISTGLGRTSSAAGHWMWYLAGVETRSLLTLLCCPSLPQSTLLPPSPGSSARQRPGGAEHSGRAPATVDVAIDDGRGVSGNSEVS